MSELRVIQQLFQLVKPFPGQVGAMVILGIAASLAEGLGLSLFLPFLESLTNSGPGVPAGQNLLGWMDGLFSSVPEAWQLVVIPLCIFGAIVLKNGLIFSNLALFSRLNARISHRLRADIFHQLLTVSDQYLSQQDSGDLLNTLASETWRTSDALERLIRMMIGACTVVVYISLLLLLSWPLTLLVAIALTLISLIVRALTNRVKRFGQQAVQANSQLSVRMCEGLSGMRTIRSFGREDYEQDRFDQSSIEVSQVFLRLNLLSLVANPLYEVLGALLVLSILVLTLSQNWVQLPTLLLFVLILYRLQPQIRNMSSYYVGVLSLMGSIDNVFSFLDTSNKPYLQSGYRSFRGFQEAIQFNNVGFSYGADHDPAVKNISFSIPRGKTTALVGPSGAGKSTLINLLFRFYDPTTGEICVDGQPLPQLNTADWRRGIALVNQDVYLFSGTVYENIAYGRLEATEADIIEAAQQANAHGFISELPNGYQTPVGDRGVRLSGGQRQRIALARAIVRNPEILILDEATNALDTLSESLIQEALERFSHDRTVVAIAHRLSTIEKADQIVVLQAGQIVEQGTLHQLLAQDGLFSELYRLQYRHALSNH